MGASFVLDPWCDSFLSLMFLSFLFGIGVTLFNPALMKGIRDAMGDNGNIYVILAYTFFAVDVSRLISGFLSGNVYDKIMRCHGIVGKLTQRPMI